MTPTPVLPSLPEPSAHMLPSDLTKFKTSETWSQAFSVAVVNPDERSEPLFTAEQMDNYARRAIESLSRAPAEPVAHICVLPTKDAGPTKFFTAPSDPRGFPVYRHPSGAHPTESAGPAPAKKADLVEIHTVHRGAYFDWSQAGCGFGQLAFGTDKDGRLTCDSECMGREWVRKTLHALADHVADTAHFSDFPECSGDPNSCPENEGYGCCKRSAALGESHEG